MSIIKSLNFKGKWRSYQQRILDNLKSYLNDKKLNIVAAPGAGKTTLGIEVIRRFGNNALILSPTIPIKNQWKTRIVEDFLQNNQEFENLISTDIKEIKDITTTTYQRLQAVFRKGLEEELIKQLEEHNIRTLVLDEAHHLRDEWYRTIKDLIEVLSKNNPDFKIIALTATPPYDVSEKEWNNYYELCGEIDEEISVPELVKSGDLCPHQDLLYFSNLDEDEKKIVYDFSSKRDEFFDYIKTTEFIRSIEKSPLLTSIIENGDDFYLDMDFTIGLVSFLFSKNPNHNGANNILDYLKISKNNIPKFDFETAENFFNGYIGRFKEYFENSDLIKNKLKELTLLKNASKVDFFGNDKYKKVFARSKNKINSILKITELEYGILGNKLREVVLLDYIGEKSSAGGMNIISTFKALKELTKIYNLKLYQDTYGYVDNNLLKLGILSGSLCVIPKSAKKIFEEIIEKNNIKNGNILFTDYDESYLRVESYGDTDLVKLVTQLFEIGEIKVLLGTHALLGEGWDSPCINTLILGSVVESFMLSNQMRGRALRTDKNDNTKTADIWHLLAVENDINNSYDYQKISKRFETFDGINYQYDIIENGVERLGKAFVNVSTKDIDKLNIISKKWSKDRSDLFNKWSECLNKNKSKTKLIKQQRMCEGVKITKKIFSLILFKKIIDNKLILTLSVPLMLAYFMLMGIFIFMIPIALINILPLILLYRTNPDLLFSSFLVFMITMFDLFLSCIFIFYISKKIPQSNLLKALFGYDTNLEYIMAKILLKVLCSNKFIHIPFNMLSVFYDTSHRIILNGCSKELQNRFNNQLLEMFNQPKEIKFIVKLKDQNDRVIFLPSAITELKDAEFFAKELSKYLGKTEVIDTTIEYDKRELMRAKYNNFITSSAQKRRRFE